MFNIKTNCFTRLLAKILVGCGLFSTAAMAQEPTDYESEKPAPFDVVISEVVYLPIAGQTEWIELSNVSEKGVDIAGWELTDGGALNFVISATSLVMAPQSYLVVRLDGSGKAPESDDERRMTAHSPVGVQGNVLGDKGGQLALYSIAANVFERDKIRGYVAWGRTPGQVVTDAIEAERWRGVTDSIIGTGPGIVMAPVFTMRQGGSIGLTREMRRPGFTQRDWGIFAPSDTNAGASGIGHRRPELTFYPFGTDAEGHGQISAIIMEEDDVNYQFQLSADADFKTIASDFTSPSHGYTIEKPFALGETRYSRVRAIYPNGNISAWSQTKTLTRPPY